MSCIRILGRMVALAAIATATPAAAQDTIGPYSPFVAAGDMTFLSGQLALDPSTGKFNPDLSIEEQTRLAWANVRRVLASAGLELRHVVQVTVYLTDMSDFTAMNAAYAKALGALRPARTTVGVKALPLDARIELAVVAYRAR